MNLKERIRKKTRVYFYKRRKIYCISIPLRTKKNICSWCFIWRTNRLVCLCLFFYSVTLHKLLSQDESLFYAHVTSRAVWHSTLRKISPSQDSYFGHMVLADNVGVNLGLDSSPTLAMGFPIHFHIPNQVLRQAFSAFV